MFTKELFKNIQVLSMNAGSEEGDPPKRRLSGEEELTLLIKTEIVRGSDATSADDSMLGHQASLIQATARGIDLKLQFENPLHISMGDEPDILKVTFLQPDLFVSRETGKTLDEDTFLEKPIPKQFPSEASYSMAVMAGSTVQVAANTAFMSQFGVTICLAISLKTPSLSRASL